MRNDLCRCCEKEIIDSKYESPTICNECRKLTKIERDSMMLTVTCWSCAEIFQVSKSESWKVKCLDCWKIGHLREKLYSLGMEFNTIKRELKKDEEYKEIRQERNGWVMPDFFDCDDDYDDDYDDDVEWG